MIDVKQRLENGARTHLSVAASLWPVLVLVRLYELVMVRATHVLPPGTVGASMRGIVHDLETASWFAIVLLPLAMLAVWLPRGARAAHRTVIALVACVAVALTQYFAITFVPLGAEFFGYSLADIRETTMSSRGFGVLSFLPFIVAAVIAWLLSGLFLRRAFGSRRALVVGGLVAMFALALSPLLAPRASQFTSDAQFFVAVDKLAFFARGARQHLADVRAAASQPAMSGYPLLHANADEDVLGPLLSPADAKPNIVIVIVEGLGRDFVGQGALYGGFTPFLDSLSRNSLYWENYMSVAGRTFGVLPALLGSLPFGPAGFMELGARMPRHVTLASILKDQGYEVSYFTGTDGHFDNIDVFMERQGVDRFVDAHQFGNAYTKAPAEAGGESWGYGDQDLFRRAEKDLDRDHSPARLDVYLTVTTHEPFIPPRTPEYTALFRRRLDSLRVPDARRAEYEKYAGVFSTLAYLDDGVRALVASYRKRPDFARTIFVVTGDHRIIPIPTEGRIDRYHVPLMIYSPLVRAPRRFASVSSHLDLAPSLLAWLSHAYSVRTPDSVSWLGRGIDTSQAFRSQRSVALMRGKGQMDEYLDGTTFVSGDQSFRLDTGFTLQRLQDDSAADAARGKLAHFVQVNRFVASGDHLYPGGKGDTTSADEARRQDSVVAALHLGGRNPTDVFIEARTLAFARQYEAARLILGKQLREIPNFHDARVLLARTYAWERKFDVARALLADLARRAPAYPDGYSARVDVELWTENPTAALAIADSGVARFPDVGDLQVGRARALERLGRRSEALAAVNRVPARDPASQAADEVRRRLHQQ